MTKVSTYNTKHLQALNKVMDKALSEYPRTYLVRVDLRLDDYIPGDRVNIMGRFISSLTSQLKIRERRQCKEEKRVRPNTVRYVWCLERNTSENDHYHVALLFNQDAYHRLGRYQQSGSLAYLINKAWNSAMGYSNDDTPGLVHFPKHGQYWLNANKYSFNDDYDEAYSRLKYLCKHHTKTYSRTRRCFGSSSR